MPSATTRNTMLRHLKLMEIVPRQPRTITSKAIHEFMEVAGYTVTRRTIERDLKGFMDAGFPLVVDTTHEPYLWSWDVRTPALTLPAPSVSDALLLAMVKDYVSPMLPPQMLEALQPYLDRAVRVLDEAKVQNTLAGWRNKVHAVLPTQVLIPPTVPQDVLRAVSDALLQETQLEIQYDSMSGKKAQAMTVHPHALIHRGQMAYLVCTCWDYTDMRRLAMHRISKATNTFTPMLRQPNFDLSTYLQQGYGDFGDGKMRNLDIKVAPNLALYLAECKLTVDQEMTAVDSPPGWSRLTARLPDTLQLKSWLLSQGDELIVNS